MNFKNIPIDCYPVYAWLWNGIVTKEEIKRQIDEMYDAGIRAFYVIGIAKEFRPERLRSYLSPDYLSDEYIDMLYYAYEVATEKGMYTWLYNEGGYPSGMACGQIRKDYPELAVKMFEIKNNLLKAGEHFRGNETLIAAFKGTERITEGDVFSVDTVVTQYEYKDGTGEDFGIKSDNASLRNTEIFLAMTHERMRARFGEHMGQSVQLMFDDEANMGWWTSGFEIAFQKKFGYDIGDFMPWIAGGLMPESEAQCRAKSDYLMLCGELIRDNYFSPMREWLNKNGMLSVGHLNSDDTTNGTTNSRYGNILQILRTFDIPGIDVIWSQIDFPQNGMCCQESYEFFPRIASSAARHRGHSRCLSESFSVYGAHVTQELMRFVVNYQAVRGISLYNFMVISYDRKNAQSFQFRPSFIGENIGGDCLSKINEYVARLSYILQFSKSEISTALYFPFRTICSCGKKGVEAACAFEKLGNMLEKKGISFDLIDEEFVSLADVKGGRLVGENVSYDYVFVPESAFELIEVQEKLKNTSQSLAPCIERSNPFIIARKLLFEDGSEGYFICNTSGEMIYETVGLYSDRIPYMIDLYSGNVMEMDYDIRNGQLLVPLHLDRGEGVMVWLPKTTPEQVQKKLQTQHYCDVTEITSYISRKYEIHPQKGPQNYFYDFGEEKKGLYEWSREFSGEVTYICSLPELEEGNYVLDLGEVRHLAKVYLNGSKIAEATMPPYRVLLEGAKTSDELRIVVANTIANACCNTSYFTVQDKRDVGCYHWDMVKKEAEAPAGGLLGPIILEKVL